MIETKSIAVLELLKALRKSSTSTPSHLNLKFEFVAAATYSLVLIAIKYCYQIFTYSTFVIALY